MTGIYIAYIDRWKKNGRNEADESRPRDPATDEPIIRLSFLSSLARDGCAVDGRRVFFSSSSILCLFCYFLPTVANGTVGKKKCAGDAINVYIT